MSKRKRRIKNLDSVPKLKRRLATFIATYELATKNWSGEVMLNFLLKGYRGLASQSEDTLIKEFDKISTLVLTNPEWRATYPTPFEGVHYKWRTASDLQLTTELIKDEAKELTEELFEDIVFG